MQIQIANSVWDCGDSTSKLIEVLSSIEFFLQENELYVSHLLVEEDEVFENYKEYLINHESNIQTVTIVVVTLAELINQLVISTSSYLDRVLPEVQLLSNQFYQGASSETWSKFAQLIDGLQWISQMLFSIDQINHGLKGLTFVTKERPEFETLIRNMQDAVVNTDTILLGDVLQFEIIPMLTTIHEGFKLIMEQKVVSTHVN
ncbi:hypothetical protein [Paenibacillus sp. YYML68]|uniref:hypothetical protein n=1 Tax=Paenibacillus sp. YYML68 TaxID=2909250 RepID=UPI002493084C|nr:hypothetical protein [Paenibacillus sp. YYML68]